MQHKTFGAHLQFGIYRKKILCQTNTFLLKVNI